jgi:nucleoside-diphosphate-sugar epimerase
MQCRDFVYDKDCIAVLVWLWRHGPGSNINLVYNLGTGKARSCHDLMKAVGGACGAASGLGGRRGTATIWRLRNTRVARIALPKRELHMGAVIAVVAAIATVSTGIHARQGLSL